MYSLAELQKQIDAAYAAGNVPEIIRIGTLMGEIAAATFKPTEPVRTGAWRNVCNEAVAREFSLESRILARDENNTMDI